jgi:hypothetical protein
MNTISAMMAVRDGGWLLPPAVHNLRKFVDQIVIVADPDSTDDTVEVAKSLGDAVVEWHTHGTYETVLNRAAMELCSCDWILLSHDDEIWTPSAIGTVCSAMSQAGVNECVFPRKHLVGDGSHWVTSEPWWPDYQPRLRSRTAWERAPWPVRIHASPPEYPIRIVSQIPFLHLKFIVKSQAERERRLNDWMALDDLARQEHYQKFSLPERFSWNVAPMGDGLPMEVAWMFSLTEERRCQSGSGS